MNTARIAVLAVALLAGGGAAWLATGSPAPPPAAPTQTVTINTTDVLVAGIDLPLGSVAKKGDLRWQAWPADGVGLHMIKRSEQPKADEEFEGAIARMPLMQGEPIRKEKLAKRDGSGFLSAILDKGRRALSITIAQDGAMTAGGFILPNDRVDVVRTFRDEGASRSMGSEVMMTEKVLLNVRVLAIGQNVQEKNGERVVTGTTATLDLSPEEVETIALAQRTGQLSLALRSIADANEKREEARKSDKLTIIRFGIPGVAIQQ
jgi:pilus assembly protein CpaB